MIVLNTITSLIRSLTPILAWACLLVALLTGQPLLVLLAVALAVVLWAPRLRIRLLAYQHEHLEPPHPDDEGHD
jgi:hypothetical protein